MISKAEAFQIGIHLQYIGNCISDEKLVEAGKHIKLIEQIILDNMEKEGEQDGVKGHS